jgi:hypothetical protein
MSHPHRDGGANGGGSSSAAGADPDHIGDPTDDTIEEPGRDNDEFVATIATIGVVGLGVIAFEAALLPGLVLGVAAALAPRYLPKVGGAINPLFKSTVRGAYKLGERAREMTAELQEQVHDIVAEAKAETNGSVETKGQGRATSAPAAS